ncbi:MAG: hypothetical protein P8Z34_08935 [Anaerolineales bacterium]
MQDTTTYKESACTAILQVVAVALMPVLALLGVNADRVELAWIVRPSLIYLALAAILFVGIKKISKGWKTSAVTSSLLLLGLLQSGRIPSWMTSALTTLFGSRFAGIQEDENRIALTIMFLVPLCLVIGIIFTIHKRASWLRMMDVLINILVLSSIITSAILIGRHIVTVMKFDTKRNTNAATEVERKEDAAALPDVYYLILDAYGRADVLREIYGYDNSGFLDFLESEGCYVARDSIANYTKTALSLITSLNLDYVQNVIPETEPRTVPASVLSSYLNQNLVMQTFKEMGYNIVTFESGFSLTDITSSDILLDPIIHGLNPFESILLSQSIVVYPAKISILFNRMAFGVSYSGHIARQRYILDTLPSLDVIPGPKFVFAHVILPHLPFVFQPDGTIELPDRPFSYMDGSDFEGSVEEYHTGYVEQLQYLNGRLEDIVEAILSKPGTPPVIILQADHGPRSLLDWKSPSPQAIHETFSILNAYCFPGKSTDTLYPGISPVNSFRILFNLYFGMDYSLLPDESYYSYYWNSLNSLELIENR